MNWLIPSIKQKARDPDSFSEEDFLSLFNEFELLILGKKES